MSGQRPCTVGSPFVIDGKCRDTISMASAQKKIELLVYSKDPVVTARCEQVAKEFSYSCEVVADADRLLQNDEEYSNTVFVLFEAFGQTEAAITGEVQVLKQVCPEAYIMVIVDGKMAPEKMAFLKKSGANIVALENEFYYSSKFEFVLTQNVSANYIPIKPNDLVVGKIFPCTAYHLLPLNKKYLPVLPANTEITEAKLQKIASVGEVYIKKDSIGDYANYAKTIDDRSAAGLNRRCRAQFLNLVHSFNELVLLIADQSEYASFDAGKKLYEKCRALSDDLLVGLSSIGEPWAIINNSAVGTFGSVERAPAISAYAGLLSLQSGIGEPTDVMIAALIADIGLLEISPSASKKLRSGKDETLNSEELLEYQKHPIMSLNQALSRKLQIPDPLKNTILCTHERSDGQGFPNKVRGEKVSAEASLVQLCELVDKSTMIQMGQARKDINEARKEIFQREFLSGNRFSMPFLAQIKSFFVVE